MDSKISALEAVSLVGDTDVLPIVNGGVTKKVSVSMLRGSTIGNELIINKQNSLVVDGTGIKYPTVDAVNSGLININTNAVDKVTVKLATAISKGQAVYVSSADGTNIVVTKASNTSEATSSKTIGLLETTGTTNAIVNVVTDGLLTGLNTSTAIIGDPVWLGVSGDLIYGLINKPFAPSHLVYIGVVTRVNTNNGEILVKIQNGFELKEIHDVAINGNLADNEVLTYDTVTTLWKPKSLINNLGYTPENTINKTSTVIGNETSIIKFPSVKGIFDWATSLFATKLMSSYSIRVNNTAVSANAQEIIYKSSGMIVMNETITFTAGTAPTSPQTHTYNWTQVGNMVDVVVNLNFNTAGATVTALTFPFPATMPSPVIPTGYDGALNVMYVGCSRAVITNFQQIVVSASDQPSYIRKNATNDGFEFVIATASASHQKFNLSIKYYTA